MATLAFFLPRRVAYFEPRVAEFGQHPAGEALHNSPPLCYRVIVSPVAFWSRRAGPRGWGIV